MTEQPINVSIRRPTHALVTLAGSTALTGQTELTLKSDGIDLELDGPGIPVPVDCVIEQVAVSWRSDNTPSGDWTLTLWRKRAGQTVNPIATFSVTTS